jgi:D-3-phosphoglycerate dehydrogenase
MAVAELCVGMMLDLARQITATNNALKEGTWHRHMGMLLHGKTVGVMGMGRIGKSLVHLLNGFNVNILVYDIAPDLAFGRLKRVNFVSKEEVLEQSDIISINVPLKRDTQDFIALNELKSMKPESLLINTARGGIVNEADLYAALKNGVISGAAVDVFEEEPYTGNLRELENCILTCHMGASTIDSRTDMEVQAVEEALRFFRGEPLNNEVYENA